MPTLLLTTKLYIPPPRPRERLVSRPRLLQKLDEGLSLGRRLILVSAPAGYGKTTLLSEWINKVQASERSDVASFCWVSLDESDNDPIRFFSYIIAALQTVDASLGQTPTTLLQAPVSGDKPYPIESVLTSLINDLASRPDTLLLVLDDYHLITAQPIHDALLFLLDHLPPHVCLLIASRVDPPLPLPRLRARDQLIELSAADLRFTPDETVAFLNQVMGLGLSVQDVTALEARTEGWVAGLQLAALSMKGGADVSAFVAAFTGSSRYILDYLVEEVLRRQPQDVQSFLLQTAILDRMTGPLCDVLTGRSDSQAVLEMLEQANLFIFPLDQDRTWYRYHRLFAEFLRSRLAQPAPPSLAEGIEKVPDLHRRASEWYERHGLVPEAVAHALAAPHFERAAALIEQTARETLMRSEVGTLLGWLEALPDTVVRSRPYLCLAHAWALVAIGQPDATEPRIQEALQAASPGDVRVRGEAAAIRTLIAALKGDVNRAIELAHQALECLPAEDLFLRGMIALNLGLAYDTRGDTRAASQVYSEAVAIGQAADNPLVTLMAIVQLADLKALQGNLHAAADTYRQAIRLGTEPGRQLPVASMAYAGMGQLLYEWNDLETATYHLTAGIELSQQWEVSDVLVACFISLAQVRQAQGDIDAALDLIREADRAMQAPMVSSSTISVAKAHQARLWVRQGNVEAATGWAEEFQARSGDTSSYLRQIEGSTWVRVLLAQGKPELVTGVLDPLLHAAEAAEQMSNVVELLALQALALEALGKSSPAIATLHRALALAEPQGYIRTFVDEGKPMLELLRHAAARGPVSAYVGKLLAAFAVPEREGVGATPPQSRTQPLVEPLSPRELEVLRLLAAGLSNKEIAQTLIIAVGTVKQHLKSIYRRLDVHSRTEAANRARELDLL